jgi:hypothetical protein
VLTADGVIRHLSVGARRKNTLLKAKVRIAMVQLRCSPSDLRALRPCTLCHVSKM